MAKLSERVGPLVLAVLMIGCGGEIPPSRTGDAGGWTSHPVGAVDAAHGSDAEPATDAKGQTDGGRDRSDLAPLGLVGATCAAGGACASGYCVDGVCCATACTGGCQSCAEPGHLGTCAAVPVGVSPRQASDCPATAVTICGLDGTCDGDGACRFFQAGTACAPPSCSNNYLTLGGECDGRGACASPGTLICTPFVCIDGACVGCVDNADCGVGLRCEGGTCQLPVDEPCVSSGECASGFCADGVCCNTACDGSCVSCAQPGRVGTCYPVPAGQDPRGLCVDEGAMSCGHDGTCDGVGGCHFYVVDTACAEPSCSGDVLMTARICNGAGTCQPSVTVSCAPYACADGNCSTDCAGPDDCASGQP